MSYLSCGLKSMTEWKSFCWFVEEVWGMDCNLLSWCFWVLCSPFYSPCRNVEYQLSVCWQPQYPQRYLPLKSWSHRACSWYLRSWSSTVAEVCEFLIYLGTILELRLGGFNDSWKDTLLDRFIFLPEEVINELVEFADGLAEFRVEMVLDTIIWPW